VSCTAYRGPEVPLSVQAMQRVLAFTRRSSDAPALSGALASLIRSSFWSLADINLLLKMVEADAEHADVAHYLFEIGAERQVPAGTQLSLARAVLTGTITVSRRTAVTGAAYHSQNVPVDFRPLSSAMEHISST
jgi:hypothetical protein